MSPPDPPRASLPKRPLMILFVVAVAYALSFLDPGEFPSSPPGSDDAAVVDHEEFAAGVERVAQAHAAGESDVVVSLEGRVERTLRDDDEGSRHQKFIVELVDGATVLVSHDIDVAPRVPLREGDTVQMRGEYEWNEQGGVLHWTHHDPGGRREGGWIRHAGTTYR